MKVKICLLALFAGIVLLKASNSSLFAKVGSSPEQVQIDQCIPGSPGMFKFLGKNVVRIYEGQTASFENFCFQQNTVSYVFKSALEIEVDLHSSNAKSLTCSDTFMLTSILNFKIETKFIRGHSKYTMKLDNQDAADYIKANGLSLIPSCDKITNFLPDIVDTAALFSDQLFKKLPKNARLALQLRNYQKIEKLTGEKSVWRHPKTKIDMNWMSQNVQSGDVYCTFGPNARDTIVIYGTGGVCEHVGMFLWDNNGVLWMVESNGPGIKKYLTSSWFNQGSSVDDLTETLSILKLSDEIRANFDVSKAWAAFNQYEGFPYGTENFLFSFIDTPEDSITPFISTELFTTLLAIIDKIPNPQGAAGIELAYNEAMNHRLGTEGLNFEQILEEAANRKMTLGQIMAIPENPAWTYGKGTAFEGRRFICSAFVTFLLQSGGVFDYLGVQVSPHEFTPNDVYNLKIWQDASQLPAACRSNDPYLPYCMIQGYKAMLPFRYNTFQPYNHMNEHCPAIAPLYERPAGC